MNVQQKAFLFLLIRRSSLFVGVMEREKSPLIPLSELFYSCIYYAIYITCQIIISARSQLGLPNKYSFKKKIYIFY